MTDEMKDTVERDEDLSRLLALWPAPVVPEMMDERMLARYRREAGRAGRLKRFCTMSIRVPLPVALAALILLIVSASLALRRPTGVGTEAPQVAARNETMRADNRIETPIITHTNLAGFEPVPEMNVTVVAKDSPL